MLQTPQIDDARRRSRRAMPAGGLTLALCLALFLGLGASAFAAQPKEVTISGPVQVEEPVTVEGAVDAVVVDMPPVEVRALDNPALSAFQDSGTVNVGVGFGGVFGTPVANPPEGTRMVIEYASVQCATEPGNTVNSASVAVTELTSPNSSVSRSFQIPLNPQSVSALGDEIYVGGLATRLYSDRAMGGGGGVTAGVLRSSGVGETSCVFSISGHVVPLDSGGESLSASAAESARLAGPQELVLPYAEAMSLEANGPPAGTVVKLEAP